ncbi:MAG: FAD binding domain-containing protein [Candidatus Eremiobacteraeota bacterium]|nr:FAD binding domain-containing protein [Candidatus Eremiobacteraeota bacterium]MBC5827666.1 FAD binding domain-containing protein [Candidatus Eremiobacteraeota bacterium]
MQYFEPHFLNEALVLLDRFGSSARILAGGTRLGPRLRDGSLSGDALVNLKRIPDLFDITPTGNVIRIGALVTAATLAGSDAVAAGAQIVATAAAGIGARQLRNVATIGGNVCSGHPAADLAAALVACDARCIIASLSDDERSMPIEQFLRPGSHALLAGELLVAIDIPLSTSRSIYRKMQTRRAFEMAIVAVALHCDFEVDRVRDIRIALGGAAPTPIRASAAELVARGRPIDAQVARDAARAAAHADALPVSDAVASEQYRRQLVAVLTERALLEVALEQGLVGG